MAKSQQSGLTEDPKFQKVVQTFLKTPPRQHQEDVGKKRKLKPKPIKRKSE